MLMASSVWIARHDFPVFNKSCCQNKPLTTTAHTQQRKRGRKEPPDFALPPCPRFAFNDGGLASHEFDDEHRAGGMHSPSHCARLHRGIRRQNEKRNSFLPVFVTSDRRRKRRAREKRRTDGPRSPRADSYLKSLSGGVAHGRRDERANAVGRMRRRRRAKSR